jgi:hypothetical protein
VAAKRGPGRPKMHVEPVERSQVSLPVSVDKDLRELGGGSLSTGISRAAFARPKKRPKKPRMVPVTDPEEIAAIQSDLWCAPLGGEFEGRWLAEASTLANYRKLKAEGKL